MAREALNQLITIGGYCFGQMGVVQLSLLTLALTVCSYENVLQECLENEAVRITLQVHLIIVL